MKLTIVISLIAVLLHVAIGEIIHKECDELCHSVLTGMTSCVEKVDLDQNSANLQKYSTDLLTCSCPAFDKVADNCKKCVHEHLEDENQKTEWNAVLKRCAENDFKAAGASFYTLIELYNKQQTLPPSIAHLESALSAEYSLNTLPQAQVKASNGLRVLETGRLALSAILFLLIIQF